MLPKNGEKMPGQFSLPWSLSQNRSAGAQQMWAGGDQAITRGTPGSSVAKGVLNSKNKAFRNETRKLGPRQGGHPEEESVVLVS